MNGKEFKGLLDSTSSCSLCNKKFLEEVRSLFSDLKIQNECHQGITVDNRILQMTKVTYVLVTIESRTINTKLIVLDQSNDEGTIELDLFPYLDITFTIPKLIVSVGRYKINLPLILEFDLN